LRYEGRKYPGFGTRFKPLAGNHSKSDTILEGTARRFEMKFTSMMSTAALAALLTAAPGVADEKADQGISSETSGSANVKAGRKAGEVMVGQMMAIQAQLGLHRGDGEAAREMRAEARAQAEVLASEAKAVLGADATPQEVREFFRARISGYNTVAEMAQDLTAVLGPHPNHGAVRAYLLLRRAEMEGLSGRETDFNALRAEIKALGDLKVGELRGLLREKVRATIGHEDADKKEDKDKKDRNHKKEEMKDEHQLLHAELKAEHKAWHEKHKEDQKEARQEKLEASIAAKVEARLRELEANTEARLEKLQNQQDKVNAKIEARREEVQKKAEEKKEESEARRHKVEVKVETRQKGEIQIGREKKDDE
jgi:hypothetical protein